MNCSKLIASLVAGQCGEAPVGGTGSKIVFINYEDIDRTISVKNGSKITNLKLKEGALGYLFSTIDNSFTGSASFEKGKYISTYSHSLTAAIFVKGSEAKEWLATAKYARVVALAQLRDGSWEVYGWDSGLILSDNPYSTTYEDGAVYNPVFSTDDTAKESALPLSFEPTTGTADEAVLALTTDND